MNEWIQKWLWYIYNEAAYVMLEIKRHTETESKGIEKAFHENGNKQWKIAGVGFLIPDKIDLKTKAITRNKEGPSNYTFWYLSKETQNTNSKRHMNPYVYFSIIYNSQGKEAI